MICVSFRLKMVFHSNSTPFDEGTIGGWFCVFCFSMVPVVIYVALNITIVIFFMSMGLYFEASCKHYRMIFRSVSDIAESCSQLTHQNKQKMKMLMIEAIRFHNKVKE